MKHLKKLSVVLMMTTLFSVSFTSCIDNEVSPLVEAIYEAQADLIAAQAGVQNAEAALLLAQANAVEAQAAAQAEVNANLAAGQLAVLLANAGLTNAQSAMLLAQAEALADMTAAQVLQLIANAGLTDAQAAIILAQASALEDLTAAQVAQLLANAGYTAAETAALLAEVARYEAETAQNSLREAQYLLELVAETNLAVAEAQNELALAQIAFQAQMAIAVAQMEAAGAQIAVGYAWDYAMAMQHANNLMVQLLDAQADLANAELMQNGPVSWEFYLAQLQGDVAITMAAKADLETAIADLEAYIANPTTPEAIITDLKAQNVAYHEAMDAKEIEMQVQYNKIMAIYDEAGVRNELVDRYEEALADHDYAVGEKEDREDLISDAQDDIADWQLAITNYPAALAAKQLAVTNATSVKNAAQTAFNTASAAQATANTAQIAAATALSTLEGKLAILYSELITRTNTLASEQATYNAGIGAVTTANTNAINAITTAGNNLATAQANYTLWKNRFEGNVGVDNVINGGWFWEDTTSPSTILGDTVLGNHTNANGVASNTYVRVESWTYNDLGPVGASPEDTYSPLTIGTAQQTTLGAGQFPIAGNGAITPGEYATTYPLTGYTLSFYVEVGMDDVVYNNLTQMNLAIAALGDADIFDVPPTLASAAKVGSDAYTNLWNAQRAQLITQNTLNNFGNNLALAQTAYNEWKYIYENELMLLDAAQAVLATANTTLAAANTAKTNAQTALTNATNALTTATTALNTFLTLPDEDGLQALIDAAILDIADWTAEIAAIEPIIAAKLAIVLALQADYDEYIANTGVLSGLYADLHAEIIAEWQIYWAMDQELEAIQNAHDLNMDLISAYGWWSDDLDDLADYLADLKEDLADANYDIEVAEQALAAAQVEEAADEAYISYLEALIDTLEQRHANTLAIAAKYKALMDAALAS